MAEFMTGDCRLTNDVSDNLFIYPNPSNDLINLSWNEKEGKINYAAIVSADGETVLQFENADEEIDNLIIDIESLSPGVYFLSLIFDNYSIAKQFIIL